MLVSKLFYILKHLAKKEIIIMVIKTKIKIKMQNARLEVVKSYLISVCQCFFYRGHNTNFIFSGA